MPKKYYEALEELRIMNDVTVADLCAGVIDERSYYRYLANERDSSFKVLIRLLENIRIPPISFLNYAIHTRKTDGSADTIRFIYRTHVRKYDDIEGPYQNVKKSISPDSPFNIVVCAYILHYELRSDRILFEIYEQKSEELLHLLPKEHDLFSLLPRLLHYHNTDQNEPFLLATYGAIIKDLDYKLQPLFAINTYELYLRIAILNKQYETPYINEVHSNLNGLLVFFANRYYTVFGYVYDAFLSYRAGDQAYLKPLLDYFYNIYILTDATEMRKTADFVKLVFNDDIYELLIKDLKIT